MGSEAASDAPSPLPSATARLLELVNLERRAAGLRPLTPHPGIAAIAQDHALEMAARRELFHNDGYFTTDARRTLGAGALGENVARNTDVEDAHRRLMASAGHRANIMDPRFVVAGFAVVATPEGVLYVTEDFAEIRPGVARQPTPATAQRAAPATAQRAAPSPPGSSPSLRLVPAAPSAPARPAASGTSPLVAILVVLMLVAALPVGAPSRCVTLRSADRRR